MAQIKKKFIASDAVGAAKIQLENNTNLRARNAANSADINVFKVNGSDRVEFASVPQSTTDATASNDLVRYSQLATLATGMKPKTGVAVASTANIDLTVASTPNPIDGYTLLDGQRILLKNQTAPEQNGIYDAVTAADPTSWVRSFDYDSVIEIPGSYTVAEFGSVGQGVTFVTTSSPAVLGTDAIVFVKSAAAPATTGGDMITITGFNASVDLSATGGLKSTNPGNDAGQLSIKLESSNPTLQIDGSNQLGAKLDAAGAIITGASGLKSKVNAATMKVNGSNELEGLKANEETIALISGDITNQYIDLAHAAYGASNSVNSVNVSPDGGPKAKKGTDYSVSLTGGSGGVTRITFLNDYATGGATAMDATDSLIIDYSFMT